MIKQDLITAVAERTGLSEYETRKAIDGMLDVMTETLNSGESVTFRNFGSFEVVKRAPKSVRNITTGEQYIMAARMAVKFQPGKNLK